MSDTERFYMEVFKLARQIAGKEKATFKIWMQAYKQKRDERKRLS